MNNIIFAPRTIILNQLRKNKDQNGKQNKLQARDIVIKYIEDYFEKNIHICPNILNNTFMMAIKVSQELLNNPNQLFNHLYNKYKSYYGEINNEVFIEFIESNKEHLESICVHRNGVLNNIFNRIKTNYSNTSNDIRKHIKSIHSKLNNAKIYNKPNDHYEAFERLVKIYKLKIFKNKNLENTVDIAELIISFFRDKDLTSFEVYKLFKFALKSKIFEDKGSNFIVRHANKIVVQAIKKCELTPDDTYNIFKEALSDYKNLQDILNIIAKKVNEGIFKGTCYTYNVFEELFLSGYNYFIATEKFPLADAIISRIGNNDLNLDYNKLIYDKVLDKNACGILNDTSNKYTKALRKTVIKLQYENMIRKINNFNLEPSLSSLQLSQKNYETNSPTVSVKSINELIIKSEEIIYILDKLSDEAQLYFEDLLRIENVENIVVPSTIALGDADGSIGRIILAAMQSGHIKCDDESILDELIIILDLEANVAKEGIKSSDLINFQKNKNMAKRLSLIVSKLTFKCGYYKLVCIGDIIHDRFSNNKVATKDLIIKLHDVGVVFIRGNHDVKNHCFEGMIPVLGSSQAGEFACIPLKEGEEIPLEERFVNCYYDEGTNKFYIHNGIEYNEEFKIYKTAFAELNDEFEENIEFLVREINELKSISYELTNFRPHDNVMENIPIFVNNKCKIIHGHNLNSGIKNNVYNINARKFGNYKPIAIAF